MQARSWPAGLVAVLHDLQRAAAAWHSVDGDPIANIRLIEDPERNLRVIMKDGKIYKNTLQGR
jgi:hypothetical protein